jgi:tetratricopeptide (TPR) repeat protein
LSPNDSQNWSQLGAVYEAIASYVSNAPDQAIAAYNKAAELDPTSPVYPTDIGRIYLLLAGRGNSDLAAAKDDTAKAAAQKTVNDALDSAVSSLNKALALKSDYAPASYQLALALDAQGKTKDAISKLEAVQLANANDAGVSFELGLLYYRDNQKDKAQAEMELAIKTAPDFANARWFLASIYEEQKNWDGAIAQVQEILKGNPDNQTVKDKLQALQDEKAGKAPAAQTAPPVLP